MQCKFNCFISQIFAFHKFKAFLAVCIYVLFGWNDVIAQQKQEDVVYLKNGSILHGTILENRPGETIKIQTHDRNIWVFSAAEVDKITRQNMPDAPENLSAAKGYYNATSGGLMFGGLGLRASMANGYKWSPYFSTGGFVSFDMYERDDLFVPVGLDLRGEILRGPVTPYWLGQIGYPVIATEDTPWRNYTPGILYHAGGGIMFMVGKKIGLLTEFGYRIQHISSESISGPNRTETKRQIRSINFNLGLQF